MCTSLSPNCQYSELSLKQNVTIPVTELSPPAAISKATVAFGARTRPSQQPSQLRNVCSRSRRRKSLHVWYSPLVAKRKLVQHRLNTKYRPWTSSREKTFVTYNCSKHDALSAFSPLEFCPAVRVAISVHCNFTAQTSQLQIGNNEKSLSDCLKRKLKRKPNYANCLPASELRLFKALFITQLQFASCHAVVCRA